MANGKADVYLGASGNVIPVSAALDFTGNTVNTTENSSPISTLGADAAFFTLIVSAITATSVTPHIQAWDEGSQSWIDILVGTAVSAAGTTIYSVDPRMGAGAAPVTKNAPIPLPHKLRLQLVVAAGTSIAYTASATLTN